EGDRTAQAEHGAQVSEHRLGGAAEHQGQGAAVQRALLPADRGQRGQQQVHYRPEPDADPVHAGDRVHLHGSRPDGVRMGRVQRTAGCTDRTAW
ncbi:unnamed protein product, partial [Candidula unifasciata]